jgi:hypothetical protein
MATDDWRLRVELNEGHESLLERLGLVDDDADELADELKDSRLAVTQDDDTIFVYAATSLELERAKAIVQRELGELNATPRAVVSEHWLADEERWDDEAPSDPDEEVLAGAMRRGRCACGRPTIVPRATSRTGSRRRGTASSGAGTP